MSVEQANVPGNGADVNIFLESRVQKRVKESQKATALAESRIEWRAAN